MATSALKWALWLAKQGFLIGPLAPGEKRPPGGISWKKVITSDPVKIKAWFADDPDMNYMVNPGSRYAIVDADGDIGQEEFAALERANTSASTLVIDTPSGGQHRYYRVVEEVGNGHTIFSKGAGDLRGGGGYVLGPGCKFEGKVYTVADRKTIMVAPGWLQMRMTPARQRDTDAEKPLFDLDLPAFIDRARETLTKRRPAKSGMGGNEHTFVTFGIIKDMNLSEEAAIDLMMEPGGWNDRCDPPWDLAELSVLAHNAYYYGKNRPGSKGGGAMERYEPSDMVDAAPLLVDIKDEEEEGEFKDLLPLVLSGEDIWKADTYQRYIIPEWLPDSGFTCLLARRGVGKTTAMLDMASRIALDMEWHGWPVLEGYYSIYFCGEHDKVALQLLRAWREYNLGLDVAKDDRFIFLRSAGDLLKMETTLKWAKFLRQRIGPNGKAVVFLDTWQRATAGASQNDDRDMQAAVYNAEGLARALDGPCVIAAHPPKGDDAVVLGSSVIENSTAAIWTLENEGSSKRMEVTRMKGHGEGNTMVFDFDIVSFGEEDEHGREITGQVATRVGGTNPLTGKDESVAETAGVLSASEKLDEEREAMAHVFAAHVKHVRSKDGTAKAQPDIVVLGVLLDTISHTTAGKRSDEHQELYDLGGSVLFSKPRKAKTYQGWIKDCFIKPRATASIEIDDEEWEIGFKRAGTTHQIYTRKLS